MEIILKNDVQQNSKNKVFLNKLANLLEFQANKLMNVEIIHISYILHCNR